MFVGRATSIIPGKVTIVTGTVKKNLYTRVAVLLYVAAVKGLEWFYEPTVQCIQMLIMGSVLQCSAVSKTTSPCIGGPPWLEYQESRKDVTPAGGGRLE